MGMRAALQLAAVAAMLFTASNLAAQTEGAQQFADLGTCKLESGAVIEHCRVGYRTFGRLNAARDNGVLMLTWLYGTSGNLAGLFGNSSSSMIDTGKFFGIAIDALANGVSSSPSNSETQHGPDFPIISMRDMVNAEYRVVTETLGLKHLHAVMGLSMGGEQTFAWSTAYPGFFDLAIPILGSPRLTTYDLQGKEIMLGIIESDPGFHGGHYTQQPALKIASLYGALTVTTPEYRNEHTPRDHFEEFVRDTEASSSFDANDRIAQIKAIMRHDAIGSRTLAEAAHAATARFLIIVSAQDHQVTPAPALEWAAVLHAPTYISQGSCAHIIMGCDGPAVTSRVRQFLATGTLP